MEYAKIPCKKNIAVHINEVLKRLETKGFHAIFNGNNFDIIDNNGKCISDKYGVAFKDLKEYSQSTYFPTIGDRVKITFSRTENIYPEWLLDEDFDYWSKGKTGIVKGITHGTSSELGECMLFNILIKDGDDFYTDCFILGDFELV